MTCLREFGAGPAHSRQKRLRLLYGRTSYHNAQALQIFDGESILGLSQESGILLIGELSGLCLIPTL
jgi:hypothetical protein